MLTVLPIRYVADVEATRAFYTGLGLTFRPELSVPVWAHLEAGSGALGIHDAAVSKGRPPGTTELNLVTDEPLEDIAERLTRDGYTPSLHDEDFGRSLRVTDPDGVVVQIQQHNVEAMRESADAVAAES
ncbi:VOC family protein [Nocardia sp. NPDC058497]|uniref:VOC family protein n=1 Tax=Nocardia sp. NPDC058497 TaxID=3346529 RepID=UPI003658E485